MPKMKNIINSYIQIKGILNIIYLDAALIITIYGEISRRNLWLTQRLNHDNNKWNNGYFVVFSTWHVWIFSTKYRLYESYIDYNELEYKIVFFKSIKQIK